MLGGGTFTTQNKLLVGSYINFVSAKDASIALADRGYVAVALELDWGADGITELTSESFQKDAKKLLGYDYADDAVKPIRELFKNAKTVYVYRLAGANAVKAKSAVATAKYVGVKGNSVATLIEANVDVEGKYDVYTLVDGIQVDKQTVEKYADLVDNDYVAFDIASGALEAGTQPVYLEGGANGTVNANSEHAKFLAVAESYAFNVLVCNSVEKAIVDLYIAYTKRMRDEVGVKFQTVVYGTVGEDKVDPNYEGVIVLDTAVAEEGVPVHYGIFYVAGAEAGCEINKTNTNKKYDGEYKFKVDYTKTELENAIKSGKLVFHKVGDDVRVLVDINSLVEYDMEKGADFSENKTIRILDQIGNDVALEFNTNFLGKIPNDAAGRISFWNALDNYAKTLQNLRAIQEWDNAQLKISEGETKTSVVVDMVVNIVGTMEKLYMTVRVV